MPVFLVETHKDHVAESYFEDTRTRFEKAVTTMIDGEIKSFKDNEFMYTIIKVKVLFLPIHYIFLLFFFGSLFIFGVGWWLIPSGILSCIGLLWLKPFWVLVTRKGLRKKGYKGHLKVY